jgi:hypothetical protein
LIGWVVLNLESRHDCHNHHGHNDCHPPARATRMHKLPTHGRDDHTKLSTRCICLCVCVGVRMWVCGCMCMPVCVYVRMCISVSLVSAYSSCTFLSTHLSPTISYFVQVFVQVVHAQDKILVLCRKHKCNLDFWILLLLLLLTTRLVPDTTHGGRGTSPV